MISAYEYDYQALLPSTAPIGRVMSAAGRAGKIMDMMVGWAGLQCGRCCTGRGLRQDCGHTGDTATPARPRPAAAGGRDTGRARPLHYSYDMRSMCSAPPARSCTHSCSWTHRAIWQLPSCRHRPAPAVSQDSTRHWWSSSCLKHHLRKYFHIADYAASKYFLCSTLDSTLDWLRFWAATLRRGVFYFESVFIILI